MPLTGPVINQQCQNRKKLINYVQKIMYIETDTFKHSVSSFQNSGLTHTDKNH